MSINIITQFNAKPGRAADLITLIGKLLPESLRHAGCEEVAIRQNQENPDDVISAQRWTTRRHYEEFLTKNGVTAQIHDLLTGDLQIRYFDDVLTRTAPASRTAGPRPEPHKHRPLAREIPKVSTSDAPGG